MDNILQKAYPALEFARETLFSFSSFIARAFEISPENVYMIVLILISLWVSKQILGLFYTTLEGRRSYQLILSAIIFAAIKYLGVN